MERQKAFEEAPRTFALGLVDAGYGFNARDLLLAALSYMSSADVADMLDANELSPRFEHDYDECEHEHDEDEDEDEEN